MIQKVTKKTLNFLRNDVFQNHICIKKIDDFSKGLDTSWFCKAYLQHKNDSTIAVNKFWFPRSTAEYIPTETLQAAINSSVLDAMYIFYVSRATCDHHNIGQGTFFTQKTWGGSEGRAATIWKKHVMEASSTSSQTIWQIFCSIPSFVDACLRKHYEDSVCARTLSTLPDIDKCVLILQHIMIHSVSYIEHRYISN